MKVMKSRTPKTFSYSVHYEQAPEGGYVAFVPALPGCHTQGETLEETERNVKEAIALYLESVAAHGEPIPQEGRSFQSHQSNGEGDRSPPRMKMRGQWGGPPGLPSGVSRSMSPKKAGGPTKEVGTPARPTGLRREAFSREDMVTVPA